MDSGLEGKLLNAGVSDEVSDYAFNSDAVKTEPAAASAASTAISAGVSDRNIEINYEPEEGGIDFVPTVNNPLRGCSQYKEDADDATVATDDDSSEYSAVPVEVVMLDEEPTADTVGNSNLKGKPSNGSVKEPNASSSMSISIEMEGGSRNLRKRVNRGSQSSKETAKTKRSYLCDTCGTSFNKKDHLTAHIRMHTGEKPFSCKLCNSKFSLAHHLKEHMMTHSGARPFLCVLCDARFTQAGNLRVHIHSVHTGNKPHKCQHCELRFTQRSQLKSHMTTHSREKPYACDVCEARFGFTSGLRAHKKIHTGEKSYACDVCEARFSLSHHLKAHKRTHTGEKPFACDQCNLRFSDPRYLRNHKKIHAYSEWRHPGAPE